MRREDYIKLLMKIEIDVNRIVSEKESSCYNYKSKIKNKETEGSYQRKIKRLKKYETKLYKITKFIKNIDNKSIDEIQKFYSDDINGSAYLPKEK